MPSLNELMAQKAELERQIAAAKPQAVQAVLETMKALGVSWDDLGVAPVANKGPNKRRVKYADAHGNTWSGVGQRPRWLSHALAAGATLEQFAVTPRAD